MDAVLAQMPGTSEVLQQRTGLTKKELRIVIGYLIEEGKTYSEHDGRNPHTYYPTIRSFK